MALDVVGREIAVDDFVYHYNCVYQVKSVNKINVTMKIYPASKTSRPKTTVGRDCCLIPAADMTIWLLKKAEK
jgi:hypothetical protein